MAAPGAQDALDVVRDDHAEGTGDLDGHCGRCGIEWPCPVHRTAAMPAGPFVESWWRRDDAGVVDEVLDEAIRAAPVAAVALLRELAEAAPDDEGPCDVGAGPLEELFVAHARDLRSDAGRPLLDAVDTAARRSRRFREALRCVYFGDEIPPAVVEQLRRFFD